LYGNLPDITRVDLKSFADGDVQIDKDISIAYAMAYAMTMKEE